MQTILNVNCVEKSYGESQVLSNCTFHIRKGEIYGLLGVNGAGKTTLMKMVLGLVQIDRGSISFSGREINYDTAYLSNIGSVIEMPVFYEHLTAKEALSMHLAYMRKKADIGQALQLVGLDSVGEKMISQFSLGMKQRLGLARAFIHHPDLLILDEPLNGLDPIAITEMRELLKTLAKEGMSVLLSSHIIGELQHTADRIGVLSGGCIRQEFSVEEKVTECGEHFEDYVIEMMRGK